VEANTNSIILLGQGLIESVTPQPCPKGWHYLQTANMDGLLKRLNEAPPAAVALTVEAHQAQGYLALLKRLAPESLVVLASPINVLPTLMTMFPDDALEYVCLPLEWSQWQVVLNRLGRVLKLRRQLGETTARIQREAEERVETERLLAVRQIVDKMSSFVAQVTRDAQGGVRYFNELPYFVSIHNPQAEILAANPTYYTYLGNRIYHSSWSIYSGRRRTRQGCPVGRTLKSGNVMATRALVRYKSGATVPVTVHTAPLYDNDGNIQLVLEIFAGTQEIERLAEEIRTTQQRYQQLFDAVPCHVAVIDRRFRLTAVNRRFKSDFGDQTGHNFFEILRPASFPVYRDPVTKTIQKGVAQHGEMVMTAPDGIQYTMMAWTSPITTRSGKLIQVIVVFADITELRELQAHLASLGMMLSTISHDLKGSITGLDAGLYLIDTGFYRDKPGRVEEGLDVSRLMLERIRKQVSDILYYAKDRQLDPRSVDLYEFAADVAANVVNKIRGADIAFQCDLGGEMGQLEIDAELVRTALVNLLDNAVDACIDNPSERSPIIKFKVMPESETAVFTIEDNGVGMSPGTQQRAFDKFFSSKGRKGTGLGLFITRKVIQRHGGTLNLQSAPQKGTRFDIRLPRNYKGSETFGKVDGE
jgi:PAS domain S-box-containing protein